MVYDNGFEGDVSEGPDLDWWCRERLSKEVFYLNWERSVEISQRKRGRV